MPFTAAAPPHLRKPFRYPSDSQELLDDAEIPDEQSQEALINSLAASDARNSALYRRAFLALPLGAAAWCAAGLLWPASSSGSGSAFASRLLALLSLASCLSSAYVLGFRPLGPVGGEGGLRKRKRAKEEESKSASSSTDLPGRLVAFAAYAVYLNGLLAVILGLMGALSWVRGREEEARSVVVPEVVWAVSLAVRELLRPVDLEELERATFELKGA